MKRWLLVLGTVIASKLVRLENLLARRGADFGGHLAHSQTGPLAISEQSMIDAEQMAIAEINQQGGLLGRKVEAVIADGRSDPRSSPRKHGD